jgi:hypothetical protein
VDLKFRDQRQDIERKFGRGNRHLSTSQAVANQNSASHGKIVPFDLQEFAGIERHVLSDLQAAERNRSLKLSNISPSIEEIVIPFFLNYFSVGSICLSHILKPCLLQSTQGAEENFLTAAVLSVAYAILSNLRNSPETIIIARRKYGKAIRLTWDALQDLTVSSKFNSISMAVMLLALFEVSAMPLTSHSRPERGC